MEERQKNADAEGNCNCPERRNKDSILYSLLSGPNENTSSGNQQQINIPWLHGGASQLTTNNIQHEAAECPPNTNTTNTCHYTSPAAVQLRNSQETCQQVALLLLKTVEFVRNFPLDPSFHSEDRTLLFQHSWAELLALTMAQYKFTFEVEDVRVPPPSDCNHKSNTTCQSRFCQEGGLLKCLVAMKGIPTKNDVETIKTFFKKCDSMILDDKEFAYLKATIFFSSDVSGLLNSSMVESHQSQAQLKLGEYENAMYPSDPLRFAHILLSLPPLRNIRSKVITKLFFQDLIGDAPMEELLKQMLLS